MNLAEIAVELRLSTAPLAEVAYAAYLETVITQVALRRLEVLAAQIGLEPSTAQLILHQYEERARLMGEAHKILKALIPHEDEVARLMELPLPRSNVIPLHADAAHPQ